MTKIIINNTEISLLDDLGTGSIGVVKSGIIHKNGIDSPVRAIKQINYDYCYGNMALREIDIMSRLKHPHLMTYTDLFINTRISVVCMSIALGDLNKLTVKKEINYDQKVDLLYQTCLAVNFLHQNNVLHLDIKPMNILVFSDPNNSDKRIAKLTDFGLNMYAVDGKAYYPKSLVTVTHRAPEILNGSNKYQTSVDIWSLAVTIIEIISCHSLYESSDEELIKDTMITKLNSKVIGKTLDLYFQRFSTYVPKKALKNLLISMLHFEPTNRINIEEVLEHKFFKNLKTTYHQVRKYKHVIDFPVKWHDNYNEIIHYYAFDYAVKLVRKIGIKLSTFFSGLDLYHRLIPHASFDENKSKNILLLLSTAMLICIKMLEPYAPDVKYYVRKASNIFSEEELLKSEVKVVDLLDGVLIPTNLFHLTHTKKRMLLAFSHLRNARQWFRIDKNAWETLDKEEKTVYSLIDKNIMFSDFLKDTGYYKHLGNDKNEYLLEMYVSDGEM